MQRFFWIGFSALAALLLASCGGGADSGGGDGGTPDGQDDGGSVAETACGDEHLVGEYSHCLDLGDEIVRCCLEDGESQSECIRKAKAYLEAQCTGALMNAQDPDLFCQTALLNFANGCP